MKNQNIGTVVFVHPAILADNGSAMMEGDQSPYSVIGSHYFVILVSNDSSLIAVPCFSKSGSGRIEVPSTARKGHPSWTQKPCFIAFPQFCLTSLEAFQKAAYAANDKSSLQYPNVIDPKWLLTAWKSKFLSNSIH